MFFGKVIERDEVPNRDRWPVLRVALLGMGFDYAITGESDVLEPALRLTVRRFPRCSSTGHASSFIKQAARF